jgi:hypothetical protein
MNKAACLVILAWMSGVFIAFGQEDKSPLLEVKVFENVEVKRTDLRLRLSEPLTITKVEAVAGGQALPVEFLPFGAEGKSDACALLFLIDKSDPKRAKTIEAGKTLTMQLIERSAPHTDSAVYAFDANLDLVTDFGTPWGEVAARLKTVKAVGMATELYRNAIEAIAILEKRPVERRALVLLSDGKAEDTTYTIEKVVEAAQKASVVIYAVGYAETPQSTIHLQSLRRLAAETGGIFAEADPRTRLVSPEFVNAVHPLLRAGGFASIDLAGNKTAREVQLTVHFEGRPPAQQTFALMKLAPPPLPDPKVAEVAAKMAEMTRKVEEVANQVKEVPVKIEESAKKVEEERKVEELAQAAELERKTKELAAQQARATAARKNRLILAATLGLALLVAGTFFVIGQRRKQQEAAAAAPVFARLQVLDGDGTEHRMTTTALRIGRGKDNDLTLGNDSVSRHHAEISRTREGAFTITELNAGNGVLVNGKPVEKAALQNEDIIELGEVRIRFLIG